MPIDDGKQSRPLSVRLPRLVAEPESGQGRHERHSPRIQSPLVLLVPTIVVGVAAVIVLVAANVNVFSHAREAAITQHPLVSELPAAFKTTPIVGSNSSISTYGLDTGHVTDWSSH